MSRSYIIFLIFIIFTTQNLISQESEDTPEQANHRERWQQTLQFGIDTEVEELLSTLTSYKDRSLLPEIEERFLNSKKPDLQLAILKYLRTIEEGEEIVNKIIQNYLQYNKNVVLEALHFSETMQLGAHHMLLRNIEKMIGDANLRSAAIHALGEWGSVEQLNILIRSYEKYDSDSQLQAEIVLAIGNLQAIESKDFLFALADKAETPTHIRQYAIDALAKSAANDPIVASLIQKLAVNDEAWIRAYSIYALRFFPDPESNKIILDALRDEFWRTRKFALEAIAELNIHSAIDAVKYKVYYDPEGIIRKTALETLTNLDHPSARKEILDIAQKKIFSVPLRSLAIEDLIENNPDKSEKDAIIAIIEEEWNDTNSVLIRNISRSIVDVQNSNLSDIIELLLQHPDPGVQIAGIKSAELNELISLELALTKLMTSSYPIVRSYAEEALENLR